LDNFLPSAKLADCIQWRLAGGKNRDKKGSDDNKKLVVPAIATVKKGEIKGGEKKMYENPNKDKICNHCKKKGHVEASCWEKHPDKIPKKVKVARNKAKACKSSAAAVAIKKDIILGIVESEKHPVNTIDVKDACVCVPIEEESNYIFPNNYIKSNEDKESPDLEEFNIQEILSKEEVIAQEMSVTQLGQSKSQTMTTYGKSVDVDLDFGDIQASIAGKLKQKHSRKLLESEDIRIADTGATSHVPKYSKGGVNHRKTDVTTCGARGVAAEASYEMDIPAIYCDATGQQCFLVRLNNMQVSDQFSFNLFSVTRGMLEGFELGRNAEELTLKKGNCVLRFDTVLHTRHGALYCSVFKRRIQEEEITNPFMSVG
jgi:hypothetical protein